MFQSEDDSFVNTFEFGNTDKIERLQTLFSSDRPSVVDLLSEHIAAHFAGIISLNSKIAKV